MPFLNLEAGEPMALDLESGQRVAIRLTGQVDYRVNLISSWSPTPERPRASIEPTSSSTQIPQIRFQAVAGQPYTIQSAPALNGPWARFQRIEGTGAEVQIPVNLGTNSPVFIRITSP